MGRSEWQRNCKRIKGWDKPMSRLLISLLAFFLASLVLAGQTEALRIKTSWGERVDLSEKIIRGQVVAVESYWNPDKTNIYTKITILISEYLKGNGPREMILKIPGGRVGNKVQRVSDTPQFSVGDDHVIFLESSEQVTGGPDGVFYLKGEKGDKFLLWLKAYIGGDPNASKEGPPALPQVQHK